MIKYKYFILLGFLFIFIFGEYASGQRGRRTSVSRDSRRALEKPSEQVRSSLPSRRVENARPAEDWSLRWSGEGPILPKRGEYTSEEHLAIHERANLLFPRQEVSDPLMQREPIRVTLEMPEFMKEYFNENYMIPPKRGGYSSEERLAILEKAILILYEQKLSENPKYDIIDAINENAPRMVWFLLNQGADPNTVRDYEDVELGGVISIRVHYSALMRAVSINSIEMVDMLLDAGADVNFQNSYGDAVLHGVRDVNIASRLIQHGARVYVRNELDWTPLHTVSDAATARLLIENGADVEARTNLGLTPRHTVINEENEELIRVLSAPPPMWIP